MLRRGVNMAGGLAGPLLVLSLLTVRAGAQDTRAPLFVFGDSQVDVGNNNYIRTDRLFRANYFPYGVDYIRSSGRFSNGRVMSDFIAWYMGLGPRSPPPFLSNASNIKNGINFASGGAGILDRVNEGKVIPLSQQLSNFLAVVNAGRFSEQELSSAVYLLSMNGNDLFAFPTSGDPSGYFEELGRGVAAFFSTLYSVKARKFILIPLAAQGCLPAARAAPGANFTALGCYKLLNDLAAGVNQVILGAAAQMAAALPGMKLVTFDVFNAVLDAITYPGKYGVGTAMACCGAPAPFNPYGCGDRPYNFCASRNSSMFWDGVHFAEKYVSVLARFVWRGSRFTSPSSGAGALFDDNSE